MRFSILVPIYNAEAYLNELFDSLNSQTYDDFEIVLIDDGSTDGSPDICDSFCACCSKARVIHKKNEGRLAARLDGIRNASGEYIVFVDADDRLNTAALELLSGIIDEYSSDVVIYNADIVNGSFRQPFFEHELPEGPVADKHAIYDKLFLSYSMNSMCLKTFRRTLADAERDYSDFYDCSVAEDLLQSVPIYIAAENIYYLDRSVYEYRLNSGSTHRFNPEYYWFNKRINEDIRERLKDENIEDLDKKASFHLLIAAYSGTTQMKYSDVFDSSRLDKIRSDSGFRKAWDQVWESDLAGNFSRKQKLILKLLHDRRYTAIKLLLKLKGGH